MIRGRLQRIANFFVHALVHRPYYTLRNNEVVWGGLINREGRRLFAMRPPALSRLQKTLLEELKNSGIAYTTLREFFPERTFLPELQDFSKDLALRAESKTKKKFLKFLFDPNPLIDLENPFVRLLLDERVLAVVNSYLGMYSRFNTFTLNLTSPMPEGTEEIYSQRWHRDSEDKKLCKLFVYLSDVDETAGPFTYAARSHPEGKWAGVFPQDPPYGNYPPPGAVERLIPSSDIKAAMGLAGTMIFCDTTGLHKGGYATKKERLMFTAMYTSNGAMYPPQYHYPSDFDKSIKGLGVVQRYALSHR